MSFGAKVRKCINPNVVLIMIAPCGFPANSASSISGTTGIKKSAIGATKRQNHESRASCRVLEVAVHRSAAITPSPHISYKKSLRASKMR